MPPRRRIILTYGIDLRQRHGRGREGAVEIHSQQRKAEGFVRLSYRLNMPGANLSMNTLPRIVRLLAAQHANDLVGTDPFVQAMPAQIDDPAEAKRLLETFDLAIDEISADVGYEEPAFFRRLFRRLTGLTPGEYRRLFQPVAQAPAMTSVG